MMILAGLVAFLIAWLWNRFWSGFNLTERLRTGFLTPLGEELIKYSLAYLFRLHPLWVYGVFGLGEGVLEAAYTNRRFDVVLLLTGLATHLLFGLFFLTNLPPAISLLFAIISHSLWNNAVLNKKIHIDNKKE